MYPPFPEGTFDLAYLDPPWRWRAWSQKGEERAPRYERLEFGSLRELPLPRLLAPNAIVAMWIVDTHIPEGLALAEHWGLIYSTVGFTWVKRTRNGRWHMGLGRTTRANPEMCFLFKRGAGLKRRDAGVRQLVEAAVRDHSRKPHEVRLGLERLYGDVRRIELFARSEHPGWTAWGLEVPGH